MADPLTGEPVKVLWVKGSGGDIGSMKLDGFATLYLDKLESLKGVYRGLAHEDEMVALFNHCTFNLNPRATSIDTPLHAFVPHAHVDHVHPDAVIAIAASAERRGADQARSSAASIGFCLAAAGLRLGLKLGEMAARHPEYVGVVLGGHGLFTWGETSKACYETTLRIIKQGGRLARGATRSEPAFGGARVEPRRAGAAPRDRGAADAADPRQDLARTSARSAISPMRPKCWNSSIRSALETLAALGTSCPDHFLRTKIRPLVLPFDPAADNLDAVVGELDAPLEAYRARLRRLLRALQARRIRPPCATPTRWSISCPASACSPSPRTRRRRASRANSTSTPST